MLTGDRDPISQPGDDSKTKLASPEVEKEIDDELGLKDTLVGKPIRIYVAAK